MNGSEFSEEADRRVSCYHICLTLSRNCGNSNEGSLGEFYRRFTYWWLPI